jgi:hypothetical protein
MSERRSFRLNAKEYLLAASDVERTLVGIRPKNIDKYYVEINGLKYPPKQVIASALGLNLTSFTTMDATRILSALEFAVVPVEGGNTPSKTESERLLEGYLTAHGLQASFEQERSSSARRPDYTLVYDGREVLLEVKEFRATPGEVTTGGSYDPYKPLREKINAARKQFQDEKEHCCVLVLYNLNRPLIHLQWQFIYAAMLGNLQYSVPVNTSGSQLGETSALHFGTGGAMRTHDGQAVNIQNTTISAIVVLEHLKVGYRRFVTDLRRIEQARNETLALDEYLELIEQARGTERDIGLVQLRTIVHENPHTSAERRLPSALFCGPYDERYALADGHIRRIFAGAALQRLEDDERPRWEQTEVEILRHFYKRNPGDWHPSSLSQLGHVVTNTSDQELVLILRRLLDARVIELRKYVPSGTGWKIRPFLSPQDVGAFFYGETGEGIDFQLPSRTPRPQLSTLELEWTHGSFSSTQQSAVSELNC